MSNLMSLVVAVAETNLAVVDGFQTAVGDGDAEDVAAEIVEDLFTAARMLGSERPSFSSRVRAANRRASPAFFKPAQNFARKITDRARTGTRNRGCLESIQERHRKKGRRR